MTGSSFFFSCAYNPIFEPAPLKVIKKRKCEEASADGDSSSNNNSNSNSNNNLLDFLSLLEVINHLVAKK